jgi:lysozyme
VWTVGYGSTGPAIKSGLKITMKRAEELLARDVATAADAVNRYALPCTQGQFDALTDFTFNLGEGALCRSTLLRKHQAGNYTGAAQEFARWIYAGGKPLPGLIKRRAAEAHLYLSDKLPHSEDEE